jgi:WhiB family transcriptional regulator, redox-sensing transcriptional regulator
VSWLDTAACRGMDAPLFFGPDDETRPEREIREAKAKAVCLRCPVREQCLDFALGNSVRYGIWGGLNQEERSRERRRRVRRPRAA